MRQILSGWCYAIGLTLITTGLLGFLRPLFYIDCNWTVCWPF